MTQVAMEKVLSCGVVIDGASKTIRGNQGEWGKIKGRIGRKGAGEQGARKRQKLERSRGKGKI